MKVDNEVDLFRRKRCSDVLFVSFLGADFSFLFLFRFGRLDDIGGRRLMGCSRIFFERSDFLQRGLELCFEIGDDLGLFGDDPVFRIHGEQ